MYYRLSGDSENFRNYVLSKSLSPQQRIQIEESFNGTAQKDSYKPLNFYMTLATEKSYPIADFTSGSLPICSEKMKNILEKICDKNDVEFLPCYLEGTNETYYIMHILCFVDCIDYEKSKFTTFKSTPDKIMFFDHIEFKEKVNKNLFKIKDLPFTYYFISEKAKNILDSSDLKGLIIQDDLFK
ncbi:MAG: hypothetical protein IJS74_03860 [Clostridia bacterium]|nr:hypothetical protein [Clostridia bacterium]